MFLGQGCIRAKVQSVTLSDILEPGSQYKVVRRPPPSPAILSPLQVGAITAGGGGKTFLMSDQGDDGVIWWPTLLHLLDFKVEKK